MFSLRNYFQGERKRKSVRGCIVDGNLAVLNLAIVKKGEAEIPGLTDNTIPRRLGPKRASKIRKLFNLTKDDDVCQYVIRRPLPQKEGKKQKFAAPKVQRLVTPVMLQRKRHRLALKRRRGEKNRLAAAEYAKVRTEDTFLVQCLRDGGVSIFAFKTILGQKKLILKSMFLQ